MPSGRPRDNQIIARLFGNLEAMASAVRSQQTSDNEGPELQRFIESMQITTKDGRQTALLMNPAQEQVWHALLEQRERRLPGRFICLKARQLGISTLIEAVMLALIYRYPNRRALVAAHEWNSSDTIFAKTAFMWNNAPPEVASVRRVGNLTKRSIRFASPHNSSMQVKTAKGELGRSDTLAYVHGSEVAFWETPDITALAVMNTVPKTWDSLVFWESTANGPHNYFADCWNDAQRGANGFTPIFLPWKGFPEYVFIQDNYLFDQDDKDYKTQHDLTDEQMAWAHETRVQNCHGSHDKFKQEYPNTATEAFTYSGFVWFTAESMERQKAGLVPPIALGALRWASPKDPVVEFVDGQRGPVEIWEYPEPSGVYVIGMDVGEGVGGAYTVIQVLRLPATAGGKLRQVAKYRTAHVRADIAGVICYQLAAYYQWAFVGVESNNHGHATLSALTKLDGWEPQMYGGYSNIYYHTRLDQKTKEETRRLGWVTDRITRPLLFHELKSASDGGRVMVHSANTHAEMEGISYDPQRGQDGGWVQTRKDPITSLRADDEVLSLAIAVQMARHYRTGRSLERMWNAEG